MSSRSHGMTGPQRGGWWGGVGGFAFFGMTPCSALQAFPRGHTPFTTAVFPALTPDLLPAIFFNTRVKWEGTNHCNYFQWLRCNDYVRYCETMVSSRSVSSHNLPVSTMKCFQCRPEWNVFGDWAHRTDNNNTQLTSKTCNRVSFRSPNGTYCSPFGHI